MLAHVHLHIPCIKALVSLNKPASNKQQAGSFFIWHHDHPRAWLTALVFRSGMQSHSKVAGIRHIPGSLHVHEHLGSHAASSIGKMHLHCNGGRHIFAQMCDSLPISTHILSLVLRSCALQAKVATSIGPNFTFIVSSIDAASVELVNQLLSPYVSSTPDQSVASSPSAIPRGAQDPNQPVNRAPSGTPRVGPNLIPPSSPGPIGAPNRGPGGSPQPGVLQPAQPIQPDNNDRFTCAFAGLSYGNRQCPTTFGSVIVAQYQKLLAAARNALFLEASDARGNVGTLLERTFGTNLQAIEQIEAIEELPEKTRDTLYTRIVQLVGLEPTLGE